MRKIQSSQQALFQFRGIPPVGMAISMALQHLVAMVVGCVTPAINPRPYSSVVYNNAREFLARVKDFFTAIGKPEPTFLGEAIPINGSGAQTDDQV